MPYRQFVTHYGHMSPPPHNFHRIPAGMFPFSYAGRLAQSHSPVLPMYQHQQYHNHYSPISLTSNATSHRFQQQTVMARGPSPLGSRPQHKGILRKPATHRRARSFPHGNGRDVAEAGNPTTPVRRVSFSRDTKPDTSMHDNSSYPKPVRRKHKPKFLSSSASPRTRGGSSETALGSPSLNTARRSSQGLQSTRHDNSTYYRHTSSRRRRTSGRRRAH